MEFQFKNELPLSKRMSKTQKFFKRLPFTTFFSPDFIGNELDKKLFKNVKNQDIDAIIMGADINVKNEVKMRSLLLKIMIM